ncbi:MAG: type II CRISPR-associated endonuclease Cas1 [Prevotellaceae bacterium]|jgi:CRISPR-associated protein Cas1|nr:type II CRISPR-associated endonuclease Cas1 [Prevotellaceae bacterium]
MIKKTLYFGNPAYLSTRNEQLVIKLPEVEKDNDLPDNFKKNSERLFPIEDLGVVVLDHKQITLTHGLVEKLLENNTALITCDSHRMPIGLMLPLCGNKTQSERFNNQITASDPLKKNLWQQTIKAKIQNQAAILKKHRSCNTRNMEYWAGEVRSGDPDNYEARSAAYYWSELFPQIPDFTRERTGIPPNNLLNYGYAILRSVIARALVGSGLLPTLGIHHHNRYNAYCLADDIMEPYRPYVDELVVSIMDNGEDYAELTTPLKSKFLQIPTIDVVIGGKKSPLMVAAGQTTASLNQCFDGKLRKIKYPELR